MPKGAEDRKQRKREEAAQRNRLTPLRNEIARLEKEVARLEIQRATIDAALSVDTIYLESSKARLLELLASQATNKRDLDAAETAWLEAHERLEAESAAKLA